MACPFSLLTAFQKAYVLNFDNIFFLFFSFMGHIYGIVSKKSLPNYRSQRFFQMFSSRSFIDLGITFRLIIHFELILHMS